MPKKEERESHGGKRDEDREEGNLGVRCSSPMSAGKGPASVDGATVFLSGLIQIALSRSSYLLYILGNMCYNTNKVHRLFLVMHMKEWKILVVVCLLAAIPLFGALRQNIPSKSTISTQPSKTPELIIDPGHGGEDGGAVAVTGTTESQINLDISMRLDQLCGLYGIASVMIRQEDVSLADDDASTLREKKRTDLKNRVALVNQYPGAALLSIHQNYYEGRGPHGAQVFYHPDEESIQWAQSLQNSIMANLDSENTRTAAAVPDFVYLMKHINGPAVLVECGFLSNPEENQRLESDGYQKKLAAVLLSTTLEWSGHRSL